MIKGKYVTTVTIDFSFSDNLGCAPLEEMKKNLINNTDAILKSIIEDECCYDRKTVDAHVDLQQQYADLYHVPDENAEE